MIEFLNNSNEKPFILFKKYYKKAYLLNEKNIEAATISSYSLEKKEVDSRFVNIKALDNKEFIFFTNYNSPKAIQFYSHEQISVIFFWRSVNIQVRIKAKIRKLPEHKSDTHFKTRAIEKNALAISSQQSKIIDSYESVQNNYNSVKKNKDLTLRPDYWGGYCFKPYYFEFWEGHSSRINKRKALKRRGDTWEQYYLQP